MKILVKISVLTSRQTQTAALIITQFESIYNRTAAMWSGVVLKIDAVSAATVEKIHIFKQLLRTLDDVSRMICVVEAQSINRVN